MAPGLAVAQNEKIILFREILKGIEVDGLTNLTVEKPSVRDVLMTEYGNVYLPRPIVLPEEASVLRSYEPIKSSLASLKKETGVQLGERIALNVGDIASNLEGVNSFYVHDLRDEFLKKKWAEEMSFIPGVIDNILRSPVRGEFERGFTYMLNFYEIGFRGE